MVFGALLYARAWPRTEGIEEFDRWQATKHLPDLVSLGGVDACSYYASVTDGVPSGWQGSGNRIAAYWAPDLPSLLRWVADPGLALAIADGSRFFGVFNELDGATYTGNVYELGPRWPGDPGPTLGGCLVTQRFEVDERDLGAFDDWVVRQHLPILRSTKGVRWAASAKGVGGQTVEYYNSPGNRVVFAELSEPAVSPVAVAALERALVDSLRWDRTLGYVRREVANHIVHYGKPGGSR